MLSSNDCSPLRSDEQFDVVDVGILLIYLNFKHRYIDGRNVRIEHDRLPESLNRGHCGGEGDGDVIQRRIRILGNVVVYIRE